MQLSQLGLTKIVTISPFYIVYNDTKFDIEVCENGVEWEKVEAVSVNLLY